MSEETGADVALEVGGQKFNVRNVKSLNTLLTFAGFVGMVLIGYVLYEHKTEDKDFKGALVATLKEFTVAQRITNCLMATPQDQREAKLTTCERIAR